MSTIAKRKRPQSERAPIKRNANLFTIIGVLFLPFSFAALFFTPIGDAWGASFKEPLVMAVLGANGAIFGGAIYFWITEKRTSPDRFYRSGWMSFSELLLNHIDRICSKIAARFLNCGMRISDCELG